MELIQNISTLIVLIMFGFRIVRKSSVSNVQGTPDPRGSTRAASVGKIFVEQEYYQIYENGHPLAGLTFETRREAIARLRALTNELESAANGWYRVERRLPHLPVRNTLGVRKIYADGSAVVMTFVIHKISLVPREGS